MKVDNIKTLSVVRTDNWELSSPATIVHIAVARAYKKQIMRKFKCIVLIGDMPEMDVLNALYPMQFYGFFCKTKNYLQRPYTPIFPVIKAITGATEFDYYVGEEDYYGVDVAFAHNIRLRYLTPRCLPFPHQQSQYSPPVDQFPSGNPHEFLSTIREANRINFVKMLDSRVLVPPFIVNIVGPPRCGKTEASHDLKCKLETHPGFSERNQVERVEGTKANLKKALRLLGDSYTVIVDGGKCDEVDALSTSRQVLHLVIDLPLDISQYLAHLSIEYNTSQDAKPPRRADFLHWEHSRPNESQYAKLSGGVIQPPLDRVSYVKYYPKRLLQDEVFWTG